MNLPHEFLLTDVRCFEGEQRARIRPITLLVGENSTGKTTFLGCYSVLAQLLNLPPLSEHSSYFNREPFSMGSFRDIVRARRGRFGLIDSFEIGLSINQKEEKEISHHLIKFAFTEYESRIMLSNIMYQLNDSDFWNVIPKYNDKAIIHTKVGSVEIDNPFGEQLYYVIYIGDGEYIFSKIKKDGIIEENQKLREIREYISTFSNNLPPSLPNTVSIAPVRSKPKRTYDPVEEFVSPEGGHVPMLMMRLSRTNKQRWQRLQENLLSFGNGSGMFSDIRVRQHGKQMEDPFQLRIKAQSGASANIKDVGYGVSQSLPILVDIQRGKNSAFLLQQPEVHLHPRAQAELANMFAKSIREDGNNFLIETHSDYIVDRMRILVRQEKILASDVSILYFESTGKSVQIHNIELDNDGNLKNPPEGYREFFLRESDRLLGFED